MRRAQVWTSQNRLEGREFCFIFNELIRNDELSAEGVLELLARLRDDAAAIVAAAVAPPPPAAPPLPLLLLPPSPFCCLPHLPLRFGSIARYRMA